jgi:hypothetical protein
VTSRERAIYAAGFSASLATVALFLHGFVPLTATDCFQFPHTRPWEYVPFAGFVIGRPFGLVATDTARGLMIASSLAVGVTIFLAYALRQLLRTRGEEPLWTVTATLVGFAALFAWTSAVGRVCLGLDSAIASRYIPYALPGILALHLVIRAKTGTSRLARVLLPLFLLVCVAKERSDVPFAEARAYSQFKQRWRDCYLVRHDIDTCNAVSGHEVYPAVQAEASHLQEKLDWLEARGYNLFQAQGDQAGH